MDRPIGKGGVETASPSRLELLDLLLDLDSPKACAEAVLTRLVDLANIEQAFFATVAEERGRLEGLAGLGVDVEEVDAFGVALAERNHPLIVALTSREPVSFHPGIRGADSTPLTHDDFVAVAACLDVDCSKPVGLLCLGLASLPDELRAEAEWLAHVLASRLAALWYSSVSQAARRRQQRLASISRILDVVSDPILVSDPDGRTLLANRGAENLLSSEEEMSEGRRRAVALNNMLFSASLFSTHDHEASRREVLLVDPVDGHDLLFEMITHPLEFEPGEESTVSVLRNVTDLQRAMQELEDNYFKLRSAEAGTRAERDRLELILSSTIDPILVTDSEGKIELMNPPAERLLTSDSTSAAAERRVQGNDAVLTSFQSKLFADSSRRLRDQLSLIDPESGVEVPVEAIATRVVDRYGEDSATVTVLHDLTEAMEKASLYEQVKEYSERLEDRVREATAELAQQNELLRRQALQLEQASAMKSQFLANASHELRTPLNAIIGHAQLMLEGIAGELQPRQLEKLERLDSNAQHLLAIINDLLDITRIEAGKLPVRPDHFELADLVNEVVAELEPLVPEESLKLDIVLHDDVPTLHTDRKKVKQIFSNLLSNALKFTVEGSVTILGEFRSETDRVTLAVRDTGIGIEEQALQTIFEPFGQSETSFRPKQPGTGLGLSICRRLAVLLGGEIVVESSLGEGSVFTFEIPPTFTSEAQ